MATPTTLPATFVSGAVLTAAQMNDLRGAFRVLQVVSTTKTDTFTTSSTSPVDVTGLSVTITPSSTSSKILIFGAVPFSVGPNNATAGFLQLTGGGTSSYRGDASASTTRAIIGLSHTTSEANSTFEGGMLYLDSPNTTSAVTYQVQTWLHTNAASPLVTINRPSFRFSLAFDVAAASTITALEISA